MNRSRPIPTLAFVTSIALNLSLSVAQCPFDPTITPSDLILCPNSEGTLSTQAYDSYQWYKAGAPIIGQTGPTLLVDAYSSAGYMFSVEATQNGCTEMSPEVLVDGWAFLGVTVMTTGAQPLYFTQNGPVYCTLDTVLLVMMLPYDTNIQWTNGGDPIPGATDDTLVVTSPGQYSASGAPALCPDFQQQLGVWVDVLFQEPTQPYIVQNGDQLCAMPTGFAYQWYVDSAPIPGANAPCIDVVPPGEYTVYVSNENDCAIVSQGFFVTGIGETAHQSDLHLGPVPASDQLTITSHDGTGVGQWSLLDATGRTVLQGDGLKRNAVNVDVSMLKSGAYWLRSANGFSLPVSIVR